MRIPTEKTRRAIGDDDHQASYVHDIADEKNYNPRDRATLKVNKVNIRIIIDSSSDDEESSSDCPTLARDIPEKSMHNLSEIDETSSDSSSDDESMYQSHNLGQYLGSVSGVTNPTTNVQPLTSDAVSELMVFINLRSQFAKFIQNVGFGNMIDYDDSSDEFDNLD